MKKELTMKESEELHKLATANTLSIKELNEFKDGVFSLRTRRFGDVAEIMIRKMYKLENSTDLAYDSFDIENKKIEVKFSTVMKKNKSNIQEHNVVQQIFAANHLNRMMRFKNLEIETFDCNIQQVKPIEFDYLYYGLFLEDCILIFKMNSEDVTKDKAIGYSDKQHRGNTGEGQFHIKKTNIKYHLDTYLEKKLTYSELHELLTI